MFARIHKAGNPLARSGCLTKDLRTLCTGINRSRTALMSVTGDRINNEAGNRSYIRVQTRHLNTTDFFEYKSKPTRQILRLYRERLKELAGPLGLRDTDELETFYPKFNKNHLSEELKELQALKAKNDPQFAQQLKAKDRIYEVKVLFRGIGFRANWKKIKDEQGKDVTELQLRLGYSHEIFLTVPPGIEISEGDLKKNPNMFDWMPVPVTSADCQYITLKGRNLNAVTQFAANIKKQRPPEPYKLKGIFVDTGFKKTRVIRKKAKSSKS